MDLLWIFIVLLSIAWLISMISKTRPITNLPPGPKPLPLIGNLLALGDKPHQSLANLAKSYGPIMTLKLGQITTVVISSSAMAKQVLQTHDQFLSSRTVPDSMTTHNHDLFGLPWMPVSPLWRNLRRICNTQLFAARILDANENLRRGQVAELVTEISRCALKGDEAVDFGKVAFVTSMNLLWNTIFSEDFVDPNSKIGREFKVAVRGAMEEAAKPNFGDYFPLLKRFDVQGIKKKQSVHFDRIFDVLEQMIDERIDEQKKSWGSNKIKHDFLHYLLNPGDENSDIKLGRIEFEHLLAVLFIAGTDTVSSVFQWAMAELLRNPQKLSKAQQEIRSVIGKGNPIKESDISRLPYLQAVIKETLRYHSPPFLLPRKALQDVEISSFTIPKDAQVLVNLWAMSRDSNVWKNPEIFEPERFLEMDIDIKGRDFELVPFGGGRRICPGLPLAMRMLPLMLGSLLHFFDWKLEDGCRPDDLNMDEKYGITLAMASPLRAFPLLV
ncbi:geraniol 8-hydroxylase-like [Cucumis sativus]|uniref:geraniol 8-hydroxylase-like n=1 Tax=Cucumis sativus TaxID=3659 RepID=UPI0005ED3637|nr:geraniol 8-hydroxylase-like [Cucumis sativus]KGN49696.2 hypothetical protein Csa_000260 [Cucumis sativus]